MYLPDVGPADVARWDGAEWTAIADDANDLVRALAVFDDGSGPALYVGGGFTGIGGVHARGVGRWDGAQWSGAGSGLDVYEYYDAVWDLAVYDDGRGPALYAGGNFDSSADDTIGFIGSLARWEGDSWRAVGGGVTGTVVSMAVLDDPRRSRPVLFATGTITRAGGLSVASIARYNGVFWSGLDEGLGGADPYGYAVTAFDDGTDDGPSLVVAGSFARAGGMAAHHVARWRDCPLDDVPAFSPCRYEVEIMHGPPAFGDPVPTYVSDVNDAGQLLGSYGILRRAFVWDATGGLTLLEPPPGFEVGHTYPAAINERGHVAGSLAYGSVAFVYCRGEWTILDQAPISLTGLNDRGQAVGYRTHSYLGQVHALLWEDGTVTDIIPPGSSQSRGRDINDLAQVTGTVGLGSFLWEGGSLVDLGFLPGGERTDAQAINERGEIVGWALRRDPDGEGQVARAFRWIRGRLTELEPLPGYRRSYAYDNNDHGAIVGACSDHPTARPTGFVWTRGTMVDLNEAIPWDLGVEVTAGLAIDNAGRIAASGTHRGEDAGLLLTPITRPVADINGDCTVSDLDLLILLFEWGQGPSVADLDRDGIVGTGDLLLLLQAWLR